MGARLNHVNLQMPCYSPYLSLMCVAILALPHTVAAAAGFSGEWEIDLRTPQEKKQRLECGTASFKLSQRGEKIIGEHSMATVGCGRLNEGGERTVSGVAHGNSAILIVTSGRNGQVVRGKAKLEGRALHWRTLKQIKAGEPEGDSGLILGSGVLKRVAR
jgi:hypothetical protein